MRDKITIPVELLSHVKKAELEKFIEAYRQLHSLGEEDEAELGNLIADHFNVTIYELKSHCRKTDITIARQLYMTIMRLTTNKTLTKIGAVVNRNHATVLHAIKTVKNDYQHDPRRRALIRNVINKLDEAKQTVVFETLKERSYGRDSIGS